MAVQKPRPKPFAARAEPEYSSAFPSEREVTCRAVELPSPLGLGPVLVAPEQVLQMICLGDVYRLTPQQVKAAHARAFEISRLVRKESKSHAVG